MDVNGVSSIAKNVYGSTDTKQTVDNVQKENTASKADTKTKEDTGVIYDLGKSIKDATESERKQIVASMKKETETRLMQMQNLVTAMFNKQGIKVTSLEDMWKSLAKGEFTADEETIKQAQEDISEDGYWGVNQTSERIFDFAVALSGGDKEKMEKMQEAVKKGFDEAGKEWGKELPEISQDTYDAVMKKFDDYYKNLSEE